MFLKVDEDAEKWEVFFVGVNRLESSLIVVGVVEDVDIAVFFLGVYFKEYFIFDKRVFI